MSARTESSGNGDALRPMRSDPASGRSLAEPKLPAGATELEILRAAFEASLEAVYVTDGQGNMLLMNPAYERVTGLRPAELVGTNVGDLVKRGVIDRSATMEAIRVRRPVTAVVEVRGGTRLVTTASPVFDERGEVKFVVGNARRLTELVPEDSVWLGVFSPVPRDADGGGDSQDPAELRGDGETSLVGRGIVFRQVLACVVRAAEVDCPVLLLGESGVGKGVVAALIHRLSRRSGRFVEVNCGAIPETLLESELFGYEKGAFTGARSDGKKGMIEAAHHGTLFLDEIGELPLALQVKLLKFLDSMSVTPIGGVTPRRVDVKIVSASNVDLEELVDKGRFRRDLFFRLNVLPISIPPLRERREDVPLLIEHFLQLCEARYGGKKRLSPEALAALMRHDYPGNVRELRNLIERLYVLAPGDTIELADLPHRFREGLELSAASSGDLRTRVREYERRVIEAALREHGTTYGAAAALGVNQSTIVRKLQAYRRLDRDGSGRR